MINYSISTICFLFRTVLQTINYRICRDYGEVEVSMSDNYDRVNLSGSVVNKCSKMNNFVPSIEWCIGKKLHKHITKVIKFFVKEF